MAFVVLLRQLWVNEGRRHWWGSPSFVCQPWVSAAGAAGAPAILWALSRALCSSRAMGCLLVAGGHWVFPGREQ